AGRQWQAGQIRVFQYPGVCHSQCQRCSQGSDSSEACRTKRLSVSTVMKLAYMYATPDVEPAQVTAIQGPIAATLETISRTGYTGVELLVCNPAQIDRRALASAIGTT